MASGDVGSRRVPLMASTVGRQFKNEWELFCFFPFSHLRLEKGKTVEPTRFTLFHRRRGTTDEEETDA